jgi:hypothetical protein
MKKPAFAKPVSDFLDNEKNEEKGSIPNHRSGL